MTIVSPMGQLRPVFADKNGKRLSGGKVFTYEPGTLTPKATYTDALNLIPNTNPINLDESGEADIYLDGGYRMQVYDRYGTLIQDADNFRTWASGIPAESILYGNQDLEQFNAGIESSLNNRYTKEETYSKTEVDASLNSIAGGHKAYQTLAAAQAAQASLPANTAIEVTNDGANNGTYQWNGTTLTKSAYDPLTQAKVDINKKISDGSINQFNLEYLLTKTPTTIGGSVERVIMPDSVKFKYTQTADTGINGIGFNFDNNGINISCSIKIPVEVGSVYISQWQGATNLNANIPLVSLGDGVYSIQNATPLPEATNLRLFVRTTNTVGQSFEIDQIDFVYGAYSRYVDESASRATLLKSNTENLINASELNATSAMQTATSATLSSTVNEAGDLIVSVTKTGNTIHNAGTIIDTTSIDKVSFGVWVEDNANLLNVTVTNALTAGAISTLTTPLYKVGTWGFYAVFGLDVADYTSVGFRVRYAAESTGGKFKNPVFTTNKYSANWIPQELSTITQDEIVTKAVAAITPMIPVLPDLSGNFIKLEELVGLDLPSHRSNAEDILVEQDAGLTKYKWKATSAPTVSSLGFFIDRNPKSDKASTSVFVKNTPSFLNVILQQLDSSDVAVSPTTTLVKVSDDGTYSKYSASNITINSATARFRLYIRMTGVLDEQYEFHSPIVSYNNVTVDIDKITPSFVSKILQSIPNPVDPEADKVKFNNIAHAVSWIKNPLIHSGAQLNADGTIQDRFTGQWFSIWGSSSAAGLYSRLNTYATTTLGCTATFNGAQGGESSDLISARMGARPCQIAFGAGLIPASGSVEVQHTLGLGFGLSSLKSYTGNVSVYGVNGTISYDSSVTSNLIFTRTTAGSAIEVPTEMYFDFIPDFEKKYLDGYGIVWAGKNDIGWSNGQYGTEELLQRTVEIYSQFKPMFKRVLVLDHWCNTTWPKEKWIEVQKVNSLMKQYFGKYHLSINDYLMSEQIWIDTGITPTANDLLLQSQYRLAESLTSDGAHLIGAVNDQVILLIDAKIKSLGWI